MWTWHTPQDVATHPTVQYDFTHGVFLDLKMPHRVSQPASHQSMSMGRDVPGGTYRTGDRGSPGDGASIWYLYRVTFKDLLVPELTASAAPGLSVLLATKCSSHYPPYSISPHVPLSFCPKCFHLSGLSTPTPLIPPPLGQKPLSPPSCYPPFLTVPPSPP